jgi:GxxExxY protein
MRRSRFLGDFRKKNSGRRIFTTEITEFTENKKGVRMDESWFVGENVDEHYGAGVTRGIIGAAIEVHRQLGPGLLESTYKACLAHELAERGIAYVCEVPLPVEYKGVRLDCGYRLDLIVEQTVIVELKSVDALHPVHEAQLLTYMKLSNHRVGLLINFNVTMLKSGIRRLIL